MDCSGCPEDHNNEKLQTAEHELVGSAKGMLKKYDPFSAVIKFLHERPNNACLPGYVLNKVLNEAFEDREKIPGLVRILARHLRQICRKNNVIELINEHPAAERWGNFIIKQKERIKFEVAMEKGRLVLNNVTGLVGVEHGVELPLEKIMVQPPKLIVTVKLGILRPQKEIDI